MTTQELFFKYQKAQADYAASLNEIQDSINNSPDKGKYEKDTLYLQFLSELILAVHKKGKCSIAFTSKNKGGKFDILKAMYSSST